MKTIAKWDWAWVGKVALYAIMAGVLCWILWSWADVICHNLFDTALHKANVWCWLAS